MAETNHAYSNQRNASDLSAGVCPVPDRPLRARCAPEPGAALRSVAAAAAGEAKHTLPLAVLWLELMDGRHRVVTWFQDNNRCYLVLTANTRTSPPRRAQLRDVAVFERILLGNQQKVIAIESGLSASSVTTAATHAAQGMGLACSPSRVPTLLFMAAHAAMLGGRGVHARQAQFSTETGHYCVIFAVRPNLDLLPELSPTERKLVGLLIDRSSNAEMARVRGTSPRTIANQVGSICRKLKATGRSNILSLLVSRWCEAQQVPACRTLSGGLADARPEDRLPPNHIGSTLLHDPCNQLKFPRDDEWVLVASAR